jgi:cytochrome c peroxidase
VNTFGDSVSVVDLQARKAIGEISLGPQRDLTLAEKGELLFYSARLSHDSWMSCHSCHTDGHTTGGLNDNFSDASFGAPKRILSLLGVSSTGPFAWNGGVAKLEDQIQNSVMQTMQSDKELSPAKMEALVAFLQSLEPPPSVQQLRGSEDLATIARGGQLFTSLSCSQCHAPPLYTTPDSYDVGLDDGEGNRRFNPPSLRGTGQRGPFFHDNLAETLEDVFLQHEHQLPRKLADGELQDLLAFLRSL